MVYIDLDQSIYNAVLEGVKNGLHPEVAAREAGVPRDQFYDWMTRGENYEPGKTDVSEALYATFFESVLTAEAHFEGVLVKSVVKEAKVNPKIALDVLRRRFQERWGDPTRRSIDAARRRDRDQMVATPAAALPPLDDNLDEWEKRYLSEVDTDNED